MISTHDPATMTESERRDEVASILAAGLLRRVRAAKLPPDEAAETISPGSRNGLDLPVKTRLSVAERPTG